MKILTTDRGLFIDFTSKDVAGIISDFYCDKEQESVEIVKACVAHFSICSITTRQQLIKLFLKSHYQGKVLAEMLKAVDKLDNTMFK